MGKSSEDSLAFISTIGQEFITTLHFEQVVESVYKSLSSLFNAVVFGIALLDKEKEEVVYKYYIEHGKPVAADSVSLKSKSSLAAECIRDQKEILVKNLPEEVKHFQSMMFGDLDLIPKSVVYIPLKTKNDVIGALTLQNYEKNVYTEQHLRTLRALGSYIAAALENSIKHEEVKELNRLLNAEKRELEKANDHISKLAEKAHRAGMAEIASETIHSVGNILNSLKTSAHIIEKAAVKTPVDSFSKLCDLLREKQDNLKEFLFEDPKGKKLFQYLYILEQEFTESQEIIKEETYRLKEKAVEISDVINAQQGYAGFPFLIEPVSLPDVIEEALILVPGLFKSNQIEITKRYQNPSLIQLPKTKLIHVFTNLLDNALHALTNCSNSPKQLKISINQRENTIHAAISDNGYGISPHDQKKIFSQGFTTKKDHFGFGLHRCAIFLQQMDAQIKVKSQGPGKGATFTLTFHAKDSQKP